MDKFRSCCGNQKTSAKHRLGVHSQVLMVYFHVLLMEPSFSGKVIKKFMCFYIQSTRRNLKAAASVSGFCEVNNNNFMFYVKKPMSNFLKHLTFSKHGKAFT